MLMESVSPVEAARPARAVDWPVYAAAVAVFAATAGYTLWMMRAMSGGMEMPGGWTMSMMWMPMAGQTNLSAAVMFMTTWSAMMIAMMLPSALPMILIYRRVMVFRSERLASIRTGLMALGYFLVWSAGGALVYALGMGLGKWAMASTALSRAIPLAAGVSLIVAGAYQFTPWKSSCLEHCRDPLSYLCAHMGGGVWGSLKLGLHHGTFCAGCCWGLMVMQCTLGMMNLAVMVGVALVIGLEKLLQRGIAIVKLAGIFSIAIGVFFIVRWFTNAA